MIIVIAGKTVKGPVTVDIKGAEPSIPRLSDSVDGSD